MNQARIACVCLVLSGCLASPARAQKKSPGGVKIYLLCGGQRQHHGYRDQAFYLAELLENTGRFEVTLGEDAAILETPAIRKYALIIANADRRDPEFKYTKAQQQALLAVCPLRRRLCLDPRRQQRGSRLVAGVEADARKHYEQAIRHALSIPGIAVAVIGLENVSELEKAASVVSRAQPLSPEESLELAWVGLELAGTPEWKAPYGTPLA